MLYHGSPVPPDGVWRDGLVPADIDDLLQRYGVSPDDPQVADHVRRKRDHLFVYLTSDMDEALSYARSAGNFEGLLRAELGLPRSRRDGWLYTIDTAAVGELRSRYVPPAAIMDSRHIRQ